MSKRFKQNKINEIKKTATTDSNSNFANDKNENILNAKTNLFSFLSGFLFSFLLISIHFCLKNYHYDDLFFITKINNNDFDKTVIPKHKLAIVVPFRDRFNELSVFVPKISKFLDIKSIDHKIYIVNQVDKYRFNRAALINIGFLTSMNECDYMAMHDVDLIPLNDFCSYDYPELGPYHVSTSGLHPEYNYSTFIGGILIVNKNDFLKTNGMSNRYWGWGKEDDDLFLRFKEADLTVQRPNLNEYKTNFRYTFFHNHDETERPRDKKRFIKQKNESLKLDITGLNNIQYRIVKKYQLFVENYPCTIVDVELFCDKTETHWCTMDYQFYE